MKSDYRRGVEDATKTLYHGYPEARVTIAVVNDRLAERCKELLTKKVTKWVAIFQGETLYPDTKLYDCDPLEFKLCANFRGAYPIKIEIPIE